MRELTAPPPCRTALLPVVAPSNFKRHPLNLSLKFRCKKLRLSKVEAQMADPSTYSSSISTDIPLYEIPGASFDQYLEDKPRVFKAIFPDKRRSQRLNESKAAYIAIGNYACLDDRWLFYPKDVDVIVNDSYCRNGLLTCNEEWRVHMLPIEFLFLTVLPVVDMRLRCKSHGTGYPPGVPRDITKVLELDIIRWELQGLDDMLKPSQFSLGVKGALYPDRRGSRSSLKGQLQMSISFVLPPVLALVPQDIRRDVAESVLKRLVENMKSKVNGSLIADYSEFKKERPKAFLS